AAVAQRLRRREPRRPGADDTDALLALARRLDRRDPAILPGRLGQVLLDGANGDGAVPGLLDDAIAFAEPVLRADAPANFRHGIGCRRNLVGLLQPPFRCELQPVRDVVLQRTVRLTERDAALGA